MSTSEPPAEATAGSGPAAETTVIPGRSQGAEAGAQDRRLTASDVRTYATLAWFSVPLTALVEHAFMWVPPGGAVPGAARA